jgi:hypothetical protein
MIMVLAFLEFRENDETVDNPHAAATDLAKDFMAYRPGGKTPQVGLSQVVAGLSRRCRRAPCRPQATLPVPFWSPRGQS